MNVINDKLAQQGLLLKGGTMFDATIIHAPPSTNNQGKQWYFRMKIHVGADVNSGLVYTVSVPPTNASDISQLPHLLREVDRALYGNKGYVNNDLKRHARKADLFWGVSLKASKQRPQTEANKRFNHRISSIRARVSGNKAPVRLHQGALQGGREERRAGALADRLDQSLSGKGSADELMGEIRLPRTKTGVRGRIGLGVQR